MGHVLKLDQQAATPLFLGGHEKGVLREADIPCEIPATRHPLTLPFLGCLINWLNFDLKICERYVKGTALFCLFPQINLKRKSIYRSFNLKAGLGSLFEARLSSAAGSVFTGELSGLTRSAAAAAATPLRKRGHSMMVILSSAALSKRIRWVSKQLERYALKPSPLKIGVVDVAST